MTSEDATRTASATLSVRARLDRAVGVLRQPRALASVALIVFALWLRLRHMGYTEIWHDQARTINMALRWLHGGPLPLAGDLTSLGIHNAPLVEYLYALPLLFKEDIMGIVCLSLSSTCWASLLLVSRRRGSSDGGWLGGRGCSSLSALGPFTMAASSGW